MKKFDSKKILRISSITTICIIILIQFIRWGHTNPQVVQEPIWDTPDTRNLAKRACFDCHSNETNWPWYSQIAPISWIINNHVEEGRKELNFSEWKFRKKKVDEIFEEIKDGHMPPNQYLWFHSNAALSETEKLKLLEGFSKTFGVEISN